MLTDVIVERSGTPLLKPVFAPPVNSGTDTLVLSVQTAELGMLILNLANAQFHQPGTVLPASSVLEVKFTATSPINANAQVVKPTTDMFVPSIAQQVNSTIKPSRNVPAQQANTGMETFVFTASVDKFGIQH